MGAIAGRASDLPTPPSHATRVADVTVADGDANGSPTLLATGNTLAVGRVVMTKYVVALEIAGVLLLVSMVGAIAMSRSGARTTARSAASARRGRERAEPF